LEDGSWKMEVGSWKLEVGSWKLEVGSWKLEKNINSKSKTSEIVIYRMLCLNLKFVYEFDFSNFENT